MPVGIQIEELEFSDGQSLVLESDDIVVLAGPNNAGKSVALRELFTLGQTVRAGTNVVKRISVAYQGTRDAFKDWLAVNLRRSGPDENPVYSGCGIGGATSSNLLNSWDHVRTQGLQLLQPIFWRHLGAAERLAEANAPNSLDFTTQPPSHPIQVLYENDELEAELNKLFKEAFGQELIVNRGAGNVIPLHVGTRPTLLSGEDRVSVRYIRELKNLPRLDAQGDGMRSFVGVLLNTFVRYYSVLLIDEPDVFLHPPQARLLGKVLAGKKAAGMQLIVATHSGDFLRGVMDANLSNVRVVRIRRDGPINRICELKPQDLRSLWMDPLLRYSNILDGIFHQGVVVCEGDADCRFYGAIADALYETVPGRTRPDVMFTHCGGAARIPVIVRALRALDVPVKVVVDFDLLRDEKPLRTIVEALGVNWHAQMRADWEKVKVAVDGKKPELGTREIKGELGEILASVPDADQHFPVAAALQIQTALRRSTPWSQAKEVGRSYVPAGDPTQAFNRLESALAAIGVFILDVGQLESFDKSVGGHGPAWVNKVLEKDLNRKELATARRFVERVMGIR
jgi:AAA domain, putative AbiEii toxin, Type IV TA system